jgi:hypothetical protein
MGIPMLHDISTVPLSAFQEVVGPHCNPFLTVFVSGRMGPGKLQFLTTSFTGGGPHERVLAAIDYCKYLQSAALSNGAAPDQEVRVIFQGEDVPVNIPSVSWETMAAWNDVALIPDLYYFNARGYDDAQAYDMPWHDRASKVVWRGSTTGLFQQRVEDLDRLPRYRLCQVVSQLGAFADVGLNAAVQGADPQQEQLIQDRLAAEGLLKPFIPMADMARYRYILDIDGNSNSWNFMLKLRLGCCVLKVESDWQQWYAHRLVPWVHYVPVAKDFSDVESQIAWCLDHAEECAAIAERGATFARSMRFDDEMAAAAATVYSGLPID